jgi:uncharacterized repeat protein (TIGR02543 family)
MLLRNKTLTLFLCFFMPALLLIGLSGCGNLAGSEETCRVVFDAQGGKPAPVVQTVPRGGKADKPADPELEGHSLAGWYRSLGDGPAWDFAVDTVEEDITLYARWTAAELEEGEWELSFNSQGGAAVEAIVVKDGETAAKPADPLRAGYRFDGWHKEAACETPWDFAADTVTANTILYAKWTALNLTVRFEPYGGTPAPADQIVPRGGRATQPVLAKEGYLLEGWYADAAYTSPWDFAVDTVEEDITLHAKWTEVGAGQAVVSFDADGGLPVPPPQPVAIGGTAARPDDPAKTGFEFDGWFRDPAGLSPWDFAADTADADLTLYAKWTAAYTITFDSRGGSDVETLTLRAGSKLQKPADPARGQDRFDGWIVSSTDAPWNFDGLVTGNMTLYARWTAVYTVSFDSRGGSAVAALAGVLDGGTVAEPDAPTRANNTFAGWHKDAAYAGPWDFAVDTVTGNTTLYAKWTAVVGFNANGGGSAPADQTVTSGSLLARPGNPVLAGRTFAGWFKEAAGTNAWNFASDTVEGNTTLYAKWELVPVTGLVNVPADGVANETLDLSAVETVPANASVTAILWTVKDPGTTGLAVSATAPFTPTAAGTLVLTATIAGGGKDASGNPADYIDEFRVKITAIRKVTDIAGVPTNGFTGIAFDLGGAAVIPANATNKMIVWSVKDPGTTGVAAINGAVFTPSATGTLVVTAVIVNGDEGEAGALRDYSQDFTIAVDTPVSAPGGVGLGEDATIKLYANAGTTPLSAAGVTAVARDSTYYVRIDSSYTDVVWYLNGRRSTASGNRLYLETARTGVVKVTVEAARNGLVDTGTHSFRIE